MMQSALATVPLPRPRPADAPGAAVPAEQAGEAQHRTETKPEAESAPPSPSPCRQALTGDIAVAPSIPPIHGPGACGGDDLVRLEAVVLADRGKVEVKPPAILRCEMASAISRWVREDVAPMFAAGGGLRAIDNFDSFECRGRNRVVGAKLSEHGLANALDVRGFTLADGSTITLTDRAVGRDLRESVLHSVCTRFTTVLGPGSDGYHEDHIHLDLAQRRGGYRLCQWNVWDPLPQVAPLLPAPRPDDAPPRDVAAVPPSGPRVPDAPPK